MAEFHVLVPPIRNIAAACVVVATLSGCAKATETKLTRSGGFQGDTYAVQGEPLVQTKIRAVHAWDQERVAIAAAGGLFAYSEDRGKTWTQAVAQGLSISTLRGGSWPHLWAEATVDPDSHSKGATKPPPDALEAAVWHWAGPAHGWHRLEGIGPIKNFVPLAGAEAIATHRNGVVRFSETSASSLQVPGIEPERIAASTDGRVIVVCGKVRGQGANKCIWARDVGSSLDGAIFADLWPEDKGPEPGSAPIDPWVSADGSRAALAVGKDDAELWSFDLRTSNARSDAPVKGAGSWSGSPLGTTPWLMDGVFGGLQFAKFRPTGTKWQDIFSQQLFEAFAADGETTGAWGLFGDLFHYACTAPWGQDLNLGISALSCLDRRIYVTHAGKDFVIHSFGREDGAPNANAPSNDWLTWGSGSEMLDLRSQKGIAIVLGIPARWSAQDGRWIPVPEVTGNSTAGLCLKSSGKCWVVGEDLAIWRSEGPGKLFVQQQIHKGEGTLRELVALGNKLVAFGDRGTFLISHDAGETWALKRMGATVAAVTLDHTGKLWLGGPGGALFRFSTDSSEIEEVISGTHDDILALGVDTAGGVLFVTATKSVYRSTDDGGYWALVFDGAQTRYSLGLEPKDPRAAVNVASDGTPTIWFSGSIWTERIELRKGQRIPHPVTLTLAGRWGVRTDLFAEFADELPGPLPELALLLRRSDSTQRIPCDTKKVGRRQMALDCTDTDSDGAAGVTPAVVGVEVSWAPEPKRGSYSKAQNASHEVQRYRERFLATPPLSLSASSAFPWWLFAGAAFLAVALAQLALYWLSPLHLHKLYSRWQSRRTLPELPKSAAVISEIVGYVTLAVPLLLPFLATRRRVLDAWIGSVAERFRVPELASETTSRPSHRSRQYHALPVSVRDQTVRFTDVQSARSLFDLPAGTTGRVVSIVGEGGVGKTMLLDQIVSWAGPELLGHPALVLVDDEHGHRLFGGDDLLPRIQTRLATRLDPEHKELPDVIKALLRHGRIVLAIDRVSELDAASQRRVRQVRGSLEIRHLLLTSRAPVPVAGMSTLLVEPAPLGAEDIVRYIAGLLPENTFSDAARAAEVTKRAAEFLRAVLGEHARVPALVVRLFVDELKERGFDAGMPQSVAALFFAYAERYALSVGGDHLGSAVLEGMRKLARRSVSLDGKINKVPRMEARELFPGNSQATPPFRQLLDAGVLTAHGDLGPVRYSLDPVAEYLAMEQLAIETQKIAQGSLEQWHKVTRSLAEAQSLPAVFSRIVEERAELHGFPKASEIFGELMPKVHTRDREPSRHETGS